MNKQTTYSHALAHVEQDVMSLELETVDTTKIDRRKRVNK